MSKPSISEAEIETLRLTVQRLLDVNTQICDVLIRIAKHNCVSMMPGSFQLLQCTESNDFDKYCPSCIAKRALKILGVDV